LTHWFTVAEMPTFFADTDVNSRNGLLDHELLAFYAKTPDTPAVLAAKGTYLGQVYLDWARYPLLTPSAEGDDAIVLFRDLRFDYPRFRGRATLSGWVELNQNLQLVREGFGTREEKPGAR
jgi:inner membrane protein